MRACVYRGGGGYNGICSRVVLDSRARSFRKDITVWGYVEQNYSIVVRRFVARPPDPSLSEPRAPTE